MAIVHVGKFRMLVKFTETARLHMDGCVTLFSVHVYVFVSICLFRVWVIMCRGI